MFRKIAIACLAGLLGWLAATAEADPGAIPALRAGDLLFKDADTATGTRIAAGWSLGDKRWGHVGIVVEDAAGALSVIHADTGENAGPDAPGEVRRVPLADFLSDVSTAGHYTVALEGDGRDTYLAYAESAVGLPFDRGFSLKSENSLYCSELVWRALSAGAGADILPQKSERLGRIYVSLSDLSEHPLTREAAVLALAELTGHEGGDRRTTQAEAR